MLGSRKNFGTLSLAFVAVMLSGFAQSVERGGSWQSFRDTHRGYAISHPRDWRVDTAHDYTALGPGKDIHGVAFVVPSGLAKGTNLSDSSYLAVEWLPDAPGCTADLFLDDADQGGPQRVQDGGMRWSVAHGSDAGAGNFYEETVYAVADAKPCIALRYFIHSTNIGNYDPGTVKPFDRRKLVATFDRMRRSFQMTPP
jgi:hypothetical protein